MIKDVLPSLYRNTILRYGDRDVHRKFNQCIKDYKFAMFFRQIDESDTDMESIDSTNYSSRITIKFINDVTRTKLDLDFELICGFENIKTPFAYFQNEDKIYISTEEFEPIDIPKVSWDDVLKSPALESGDMSLLCEPVLDYLGWESHPDLFDETIEKYLQGQTDIRIDIIYKRDTALKTSKTNVIYFFDETLGVINCSGYDGFRHNLAVFSTEKWYNLMEHIIEKSGVDKLIERDKLTVIDLSKDADEYTFVPGVSYVTQKQRRK